MSNFTRTLAVGAALAAVVLAGMTTAAHAQATEPTRQDARRPPTQGQVGEAWHQHPVTGQAEVLHVRAMAEVPVDLDDLVLELTEADEHWLTVNAITWAGVVAR
jgi:hypothetical protein